MKSPNTALSQPAKARNVVRSGIATAAALSPLLLDDLDLDAAIIYDGSPEVFSAANKTWNIIPNATSGVHGGFAFRTVGPMASDMIADPLQGIANGSSHFALTVNSAYRPVRQMGLSSNVPANYMHPYASFQGNIGVTYVGFQVQHPDTNQIHFGWAQISKVANPSQLTVHQYAYNSVPNESIHIADIPEPTVSGLAALALGAAGLRRRHRKTKNHDSL